MTGTLNTMVLAFVAEGLRTGRTVTDANFVSLGSGQASRKKNCKTGGCLGEQAANAASIAIKVIAGSACLTGAAGGDS
jgi:hypothetical protein